MSFLLVLLLAAFAPASHAAPAPSGVAFGINELGGQVSWRYSDAGMAEFRYMPGDQEDPSSNSVYGFRTYRFFPTKGPVEFFCGGELSYLSMQPLDDGVAVTSFAGRGFLGVQLALRQVRIGADIGPYLMGLGREIGLSPVLRTYLSVQLF